MAVANCCQLLACEYQQLAELKSEEGGKQSPLLRQSAAQVLRQFEVAGNRYQLALKVGGGGENQVQVGLSEVQNITKVE